MNWQHTLVWRTGTRVIMICVGLGFPNIDWLWRCWGRPVCCDLAALNAVPPWAYSYCRGPVPKMSYGSGGRGVLIVSYPISTQSVWQACVAITTAPRVAFLSHQPERGLLSVGSFLGHGTEEQQATTMSAVVRPRDRHIFHWISAVFQKLSLLD